MKEKAIKKTSGVSVILAGAGTGKTHTIVEKIKYLISEGVYKPEKIVCLTFSNEAANSLLSRVRGVLPDKEKEPIVRTFHGFSADLLREWGEKIGVGKEFKILDPDQAKVMLHTNFKIQPMLCHRYIAVIGNAKDLGIEISDVDAYLERALAEYEGEDLEKKLEDLQFDFQTLHLKKSKDEKAELKKEIEKVGEVVKLKKFLSSWKGYEKIKIKRGYLDYSDLNNRALELMKKHPELALNFEYVVVDEFQDTNKVQLDLLVALASHKNVAVVGDLNQSIYRFRGAYRENFNDFKKIFNVERRDIFNLDLSYRSSNKILATAHELILNNYEDPKDCFEVKNFEDREGENVEVYELKNGKEEARKVVELIKNEIGAGTAEEEICVMCRTHQQARVIKSLLEFEGIDFSSVNKDSLIKSKEVRAVTDYLFILEKLKNKKKGGEQAWWDLIYQLHFSEDDLIKIGKFIKNNRESENICALLLTSISKLPLSENGRTASRILVERINGLIPLASKKLEEFLLDVYNYAGFVKGNKSREEKITTLNLNKFYELVKEQRKFHGLDLSGFVNYLNVLGALNIEISSSDLEKKGVRLMTSHSTKGLEYETVIITNLAQKRFPMIKYSGGSLIPTELNPEFKGRSAEEYDVLEYERKNQLLEERRLCYVSFTRAKEKLILTYAKEYGGKKFNASQFLDEIDYKKNSNVSFFVDDGEKYVEPKAEIKSADKLEEKKERKTKEIRFSPSSLLLFTDCQKKYEYKYVYNMPEKKVVNWEAIQLGSFVHLILERGVNGNFRTIDEFEVLARDLHSNEEWNSSDLNDALHLIKVFFARHKGKYNEKSKTEQVLNCTLDGINFIGFADRIDFSNDGLTIIDYKTGKSAIAPKNRSWQLGYYALAAASLGKVRKINLEMLRLEKPLEFEVDSEGNAIGTESSRVSGFNINEVREELVSCAREILEAYKNGFKACEVEGGCEFCEEYVY